MSSRVIEEISEMPEETEADLDLYQPTEED